MESVQAATIRKPALFLPEPKTAEQTGLDFELIIDLCLKTIYFTGRPSAYEICQRVCLPFAVVEGALSFLRKQGYLEIVGSTGATEQDYQYTLTSKGASKTQEVLERNHYVGPAPVPFDLYASIVARQSIGAIEVSPERLSAAFDELMFGPDTMEQIGTAVGSGRSVFLYGPPGNGKSTIAERVGAMLPDEILIPYAIEVFGQIVRVHEPRIHLASEETPIAVDQDAGSIGHGQDGRDRRWAINRRPVLIAGGELTLADLELRYSSVGKFYLSPHQLMANNGVLVIDDFGRQRVAADELLNRWMVPMDRGVDHLTFQTGETVTVPFDLMLIFATNLTPSKLGDEAFFRRIRHKVFVPDPDEATFRNILRAATAKAGLQYTDEVASYLITEHYHNPGRPFRGVHPRDILDLISDIAKFRRQPPAFTREWLDLACRSYFVDD